MLKTVTLSLVATAALGFAAVAAAADPTPSQIYEAVQNGQLASAQQMINQVLQDRPRSAKAHYIAAEVDARIGDLNAARQQLAQARQLDPSLSFADAHSRSELEAQLSGRHVVTRGPAQAFAPAPAHSSVPWVLIIVLVAGGLLLWSLFRRRQQAVYYQQPMTGQPMAGPGSGPQSGGPGLQSGYGYGAPYPPAPGGGMGSGVMGGLATGLAVGAGVAAGESLVNHMINGNSTTGYIPPPANPEAADFRDEPVNQDAGGYDFGTSGGNDWGNDSSDNSWGNDSSGGDFGGGGGGGDDWT